MKKVFLVAALAVFGFSANAQDINFGVKAGANFANIGGDDANENNEMKIGLHVGVLAEFMLTDQFAIQPELLYSMQGSKQEYSESGGGVTAEYSEKLKLDYISLPILAKYYFTEGFNLHLGPQLGFLVSANQESEVSASPGDFPEEGTTETDVKDGYNSFDYGVAVGAGYKLENGLFFNARYYLGLATLPDTEADVSIKNNNIQVSVGYMF